MRLELLIPTYKRPALVRAALASVARASRPRAMEVSVTVIDNDTEPLVLEPGVFESPYPVRVLHERRRGKSAGLNAGIATSTADYIGLIDDDEEIAVDWLQVVERALEGREFDFIGGPVVLQSLTNPPSWLPSGYPAVLGSADGGSKPILYGPGFPGILMGGNAVISRALLLSVGPYCTSLGPRPDRRLCSSEDEDMYWRLMDVGARGQYLPSLVVYHHVHPERLEKRYYRSWCFWNGASKGMLSHRRPPGVAQIAGVPRYAIGEAVFGLLTWLRALLPGGSAARRMAGELPLWHLAGRLYGRFWQRADPARSARAWRDELTGEPRQYADDSPIIDSSTR
jgi:glucosyl-dolichyl phosphate glucuronosyltransferase